MPKSRGESGEKNLIADKLRQLRESHGFSQRKLAMEFQLMGLDIDRNVITRIETKQRYVTDIELCAIMKVFQISSEELLDGWENKIQFVHTPENEEQKRVRVSLKNFPSEEDMREPT
ncbi:helix-turn-helix domain-containing protein [Brotaphodocola sp.]|uniref:helix-turn-helix domain-containing protein n=1 Tax=Brotaphodocola sp. TaxID=3073577 RepID=UPI003D7D4D38